jgi:hypothetical protein
MILTTLSSLAKTTRRLKNSSVKALPWCQIISAGWTVWFWSLPNDARLCGQRRHKKCLAPKQNFNPGLQPDDPLRISSGKFGSRVSAFRTGDDWNVEIDWNLIKGKHKNTNFLRRWTSVPSRSRSRSTSATSKLITWRKKCLQQKGKP